MKSGVEILSHIWFTHQSVFLILHTTTTTHFEQRLTRLQAFYSLWKVQSKKVAMDRCCSENDAHKFFSLFFGAKR